MIKWMDESGLPGAEGEDGLYNGGDTAAILGTLWTFGIFLDKGLSFVDEIPTRHPDITKWWG